MTLSIGTRVRIKDTYSDDDYSIPVVGTIEDILNYDGVDRFVVMIDEEQIKAAGHDPRMFPPGGEFTADRLTPV
jgi:hypothetical protein